MGHWRLRLLLVLAGLCALVAAAPALADPHLNPALTKRISALVNRFVHDVVLQENFPDGWRITGPGMRGGITRKAWYAGRALPVWRLDLIGDDWSHAWCATYATRNELGLTLTFRIGHGENTEMWDEELVLDRVRGTWLVNALYTNAIFRLRPGLHGSCLTSHCQVTGLGDLAPRSGDGAPTPGSGHRVAPAVSRLGSSPFWYIIGICFGVPLTVLVYVAHGQYRERRAWVDYINTKRP